METDYNTLIALKLKCPHCCRKTKPDDYKALKGDRTVKICAKCRFYGRQYHKRRAIKNKVTNATDKQSATHLGEVSI